MLDEATEADGPGVRMYVGATVRTREATGVSDMQIKSCLTATCRARYYCCTPNSSIPADASPDKNTRQFPHLSRVP